MSDYELLTVVLMILDVDDNALSVNIGRIRDKLSAIGATDFIKTKHRQGYII